MAQVPFDGCVLTIDTPDGRRLYQRALDRGEHSIVFRSQNASRLLIVRWSSPGGKGIFKAAVF